MTATRFPLLALVLLLAVPAAQAQVEALPAPH